MDYEEYGFDIKCLSNVNDIKYNFQEKLQDLKFEITEYKAHFNTRCFNCSSSFHCSTFEDGHFNLEKMLINRTECAFCRRYWTKERSFSHCCNICNASFKNCRLLFHHRRKEHRSKKPLQCVACRLSLTNGSISKHARKHKLPYICIYCKKRYDTKRNLESHLLNLCTSASVKELKCKLCSKEFDDKYKFQLHQGFHKKPFECNYCNKRFSQSRYVKIHSYIHTGDMPYNCRFCNKSFAIFYNFKRHQDLRVCTDNPRKDFKCHLCPKMFNTQERLSNHMLSHSGIKPFQCEYCLKQYKNKSFLDIHLFEHTGDKKFKCDLCDKSFAKQFLLNKHKPTHLVQSFQCKYCPKKFRAKQTLDIHLFDHIGGKTFKCDVCDKTFAKQFKLNNHKPTHLEKLIECQYCPKKYKSKVTLNRHIFEHIDGSKKFKCDLCDKIFAKQFKLNQHKFVHMKKSSQCTICSKFYKKFDLSRHYRRVHKI